MGSTFSVFLPRRHGRDFGEKASIPCWLSRWRPNTLDACRNTMLKVEAAAILHEGKTWTGKRHHLILRRIADTTKEWPITSEQGFVLSDGRFADRAEAARVAYAAGQIAEPKRELFSEDVFKVQD